MTAIIGRDHELETLEGALESARRSAGSCWILAGEAGIGKSRLIEELKRRAASENFTILQGNCFEQSSSFPYAPWVDAVRAALTPLGAADIKRFLGRLAPEFMRLLPELALLIPSLQPTPALEPQAEKYRLFESFARLGSSISRRNPLVFVLEDLHWADALSLELIQYLAHRIQGQAIMLIGTYRSEEVSLPLLHLLSELNRERLAQEISLRPLNREEIEHMARVLLALRDRIPSGFVDALLALTDGNPFFIEETLKSLMDEARSDELLQQKTLDELQVPHTIQWMVQQRFEQLPETTRTILVYASVMGQRFDFRLLQETTAQNEQQLLKALKESTTVHLIVQESADQFAFKHALTRDAVYSMSMLREQKTMHRMVGEALERLAGTRPDTPAAQPAYHFYQAGVWQKALEYSQSAGEMAQELYAPRAAVTHFTRALDAAQQLGISQPVSCLRGRAQACEMLGEFDRARRDYEIALELTRRGAIRGHEWQLLIDLGFLWQSRDWVRAGEYFKQAFDLAHTLEDNTLIAQSLKRLGNWDTNRGQPRDALAYHQQALELFRTLEDRRGMAQTLDLMGFDSYALGEVVQGAMYGEQAVPILRELDDRPGLVNTLTNLSLRVRFDTEVMGDIDLPQLARLSEAAAEIAQSCDYRKGEADAFSKAAICFCRAGDYGHGLELVSRAWRIAAEIQHRELLASIHLTWGIEFYFGLLAFAEAREHLEAAHTGAHEIGSTALLSIATARLASVYIEQQDFAHARELMGTILHDDLPADKDLTFLARGCWATRAELELASGNPVRALEIVERLIASTANLAQHGPQSVPRLAQLRGQALAALGRNEEAVLEFQGAQSVSQKQGQRPMQWRLHADLGKAYRATGHREEAEREFASARTIIQDIANTLPEAALRDHFVKKALAALPAAPVLTVRTAVMKEFGGLTEREREVAALVAQGKSNQEIAEALVVTVRTVEAHITRILDKLRFRSRTEIAAWAIAKGLARIPGDSVR